MKRYVLAFVLFVACVWQAHAQGTLYGIDVPGNLFTIDLSNGAGALVGVLPNGPYDNPDLPGYNEVEYDNVGGQAWAQQRNGNFAAQQFNINDASGIGAPVPNGSSWHGLEYVGSTLYAAGFAGVGGPGSLATLNPATGASVILGAFFTQNSMTGLAYDTTTNVMYGIDGGASAGVSTLYTVSLANGLATPVGATGITAGSLQFGPDGNLYAGGVGMFQGNLYQISTLDGSNSFVGATGFGVGQGNGISGLTLVIPEPGCGLLLLTGFSVLLFSSRRRSS